ncbi:hypothetical protein Lepto7376_4316 [[Leptolyngbya] sp. PCC 7376]|uniref:PH domain-containing protein n=1 Tax=[Leptolyngbya] sp. PCC 7376 TaxID=111781 RepID=UPI00029F2F05|nr:PH domain-containing protein [[Leptolyngbya] sp. PCC 7376]AFY40425.1 hypothetical protein Lepto7376_4316 [[Leptolyngbya] sp. PCC 7376]
MTKALFFKAPWCQALTYITAGTGVLLVAAVIVLLVVAQLNPNPFFYFTAALLIVVIVLSAAFMVRGYEIAGDRLVIQRLGWQTEIALNDLTSATYDPEAMDKSLRLFGNGGFFAFVGKFRNKKLGNYDAYATAPRLSVVLEIGDKKTVVITPEKPEQFVENLPVT